MFYWVFLPNLCGERFFNDDVGKAKWRLVQCRDSIAHCGSNRIHCGSNVVRCRGNGVSAIIAMLHCRRRFRCLARGCSVGTNNDTSPDCSSSLSFVKGENPEARSLYFGGSGSWIFGEEFKWLPEFGLLPKKLWDAAILDKQRPPNIRSTDHVNTGCRSMARYPRSDSLSAKMPYHLW